MTIQERLKIYSNTYKKEPYHRKIQGTTDLLDEAVEVIDRLQNTKKRDEVFRRCIVEYGANSQIDMALEEMAELSKALLKLRREKDGNSKSLIDDVIDEIADVRIMCRQMELLFQAEDRVEKRIDFKVKRQMKRLENNATLTHLLKPVG